MGTGGDGLRLAEEQNYDLILSDIDLPGMDGFEICRRVKQNPKYRNVPLILMSGRLAEENEARAIHLGAVDYLCKPFIAGAPVIVKALFTAFGIGSSAIDVGTFQ